MCSNLFIAPQGYDKYELARKQDYVSKLHAKGVRSDNNIDAAMGDIFDDNYIELMKKLDSNPEGKKELEGLHERLQADALEYFDMIFPTGGHRHYDDEERGRIHDNMISTLNDMNSLANQYGMCFITFQAPTRSREKLSYNRNKDWSGRFDAQIEYQRNTVAEYVTRAFTSGYRKQKNKSLRDHPEWNGLSF